MQINKLMHNILLTLLIVLLSACSTQATPTTTSAPEPTIEITLTKKPVPTATTTPTPSPDLTTLGQPEKPFSSRWKKLTYNENDFDVYQKIIHGRIITIAWEKTANIPETKRFEISDFYFQSFINWWDIFQGFPYDSYTVILKMNGNNTGEKGNGYEATASDYSQVLNDGLQERISHEVLHAWIGNAVCDSQERKFDDGLWFREGFTQYYGDRGSGEKGYQIWMSDHFRVYTNEIFGTQYDIPLSEMPYQQNRTGKMFGQIRLNVYWKGALVAYMMDERLIKKGLSLDNFLKFLYDNYTLKNKCFKTTDAIKGLNNISGEDWSGFFNAYIFGTDKLPLNGSFEYLNHNQ